MPSLSKTIAIIRAAHDGQTDAAGQPYWHHPVRVMKRLDGQEPFPSAELLQIALLHDVIEDSPLELNDLRLEGFSEAVIDAVRLLTRRPGEIYFDYIRRIAASRNAEAIKVKLADISDNLDPNRPIIDSLARRYHTARTILQGALQ